MKTLISQLILPLPIFWMLVLIAVVAARRQKKTLSISFLGGAMFWLLVITTPLFPNWLVSKLEYRYEVFTPNALKLNGIPVNILVLGSGHTNDARLPPNDQLSTVALARLAESIRLHRQIDNSTLITSGYSESGPSQAELLAKTALLLGVDTKIQLLVKPKNTWMEVTEYKRLFGDSAQLIVVTSAVHMPRTIYLFRKAGLSPIAAPTEHLVKINDNRDPWFWSPSSNNIQRIERAFHEYAGMLWSKLGGE